MGNCASAKDVEEAPVEVDANFMLKRDNHSLWHEGEELAERCQRYQVDNIRLREIIRAVNDRCDHLSEIIEDNKREYAENERRHGEALASQEENSARLADVQRELEANREALLLHQEQSSNIIIHLQNIFLGVISDAHEALLSSHTEVHDKFLAELALSEGQRVEMRESLGRLQSMLAAKEAHVEELVCSLAEQRTIAARALEEKNAAVAHMERDLAILREEKAKLELELDRKEAINHGLRKECEGLALRLTRLTACCEVNAHHHREHHSARPDVSCIHEAPAPVKVVNELAFSRLAEKPQQQAPDGALGSRIDALAAKLADHDHSLRDRFSGLERDLREMRRDEVVRDRHSATAGREPPRQPKNISVHCHRHGVRHAVLPM